MLTTSADYKTAIAAPGRTFEFTVEVDGFRTISSGDSSSATITANDITLNELNVTVPIVQSGSGTPSVSNPRPLATPADWDVHITHGGTTRNFSRPALTDFYGGTFYFMNGQYKTYWNVETVDGTSDFTVSTFGSLTVAQYTTSRLLYGNLNPDESTFVSGCYCDIFRTLPITSIYRPAPSAGDLDTNDRDSTISFYFSTSDVAATVADVQAWFTSHPATVVYRCKSYAMEYYSMYTLNDEVIDDGENTFYTNNGTLYLNVGVAAPIDISKVYSIDITEAGAEQNVGVCPGNFMRNQCNLKVDKSLQTFLKNNQVSVYVSVDGASDVIPLGRFWVTESKENVDGTVSVVAYDSTSRMEEEDKWIQNQGSTVTMTMGTLIEQIEQTTNCHITNKNLLPLTDNIPIAKLFGLSFRDELSYLVGYAGYCLRSNRYGNYELFKFGKSYGDYVLVGNRSVTDSWGKPKIFERGLSYEKTPWVIDTLIYTDGENIYETTGGSNPLFPDLDDSIDGNAKIEYSNPIMTESRYLADTYYSGYEYTEASLNWRCDPSVQIGDLIGIRIDADTTLKIPVMAQTFNIDGGLRGTINAYAAVPNDTPAVVSPTDKKIKSVTQVLEEKIATAQSSADAAQTRADAAYTRAGTGITNAATAQSRADSAYTLANTANTTANTVTSTVSNIGTIPTRSTASSVSCATSTNKTICSISLAAGKWILIGTISYTTNATGVRWNYLGTGTSTGTNAQTNVSTSACSNTQTFIQNVQVYAPSSTTTYNLVGWQNSGSTLTCTGHIVAIRIK